MNIKSENLIGIEIDQGCVKIAIPNAKGAVAKCGQSYMPSPLSSMDNSAKRIDLICQTLKIAASRAGIKPGKAAMLVHTPNMIVRRMSFPQMKSEMLYENIVTEMSSFLPMQIDRYNLQYKVMYSETNESSKQMVNVLVVATPADELDEYIQATLNAGYKLLYVDCLENVQDKLMRYIGAKGKVDTQHVAILNVSHKHSSILIFSEGRYYYGRQMNQTISHNKTKDMDQQRFLDSNNHSAAAADVKEFIDSLAADFASTIDYASYSGARKRVTHVFVCGDFCEALGICEYFQEVLNIPVSLISSILPPSQKPSGVYSNAVALSLREFKQAE